MSEKLLLTRPPARIPGKVHKSPHAFVILPTGDPKLQLNLITCLIPEFACVVLPACLALKPSLPTHTFPTLKGPT